ncbi:MAG: hypothetical protein LBC64_00635 [Fibromonadaceae bacterium]|jgi:hypothetical protein|nr:hypothetical protein [Fibromonadaceae bacterium]
MESVTVMESILNIIFNAENGRMLATLVTVFSCFVWLKTSLGKKIDGVEVSLSKRIDELKYNDFAHLSGAFEALTYVLEKNSSLSKEDKEFVDSRLAR